MEYRAKARSNMQAKAGKNYGATTGTKDTTRGATADDAPDGTPVVNSKTNQKNKKSSNTQGPLRDGYKLPKTPAEKLTESVGNIFKNSDNSAASYNKNNKNKTPFKMGGFGSKNKNN